MKEYVVVYSYDASLTETYYIGVRAKNYGAVELNIKKILRDGVEMTAKECKAIVDNNWYFIITLDDEVWFDLEEA